MRKSWRDLCRTFLPPLLHMWETNLKPFGVYALLKCTILNVFTSKLYFRLVNDIACTLIYIYIETLHMCNLHVWRLCNYYSYSASAFTPIVLAKCKETLLFLKNICRKRSEIMF